MLVIVLVIILFTIAFVTNIPIIIYLTIPGLAITTLIKNNGKPSDVVINSLGFSLVWWIASFWLLKYLPVNFTTWIGFTLIISAFLLIFPIIFNKISKKHSSNQITIKLSTLFVLLLTYLYFTNMFSTAIAPQGADMATHLYTASVIEYYDAFPPSYKPIVPIDNFGEQPFGFSIIVLLFKIINSENILKAGIAATVISFTFFYTALFSLIRRFFNTKISTLTLIIAAFFHFEFLSYISWGGISTVTSLALALFSVKVFIQYRNHLKKQVLLASISFFATLTTHPIPVIFICYFIIPTFIYTLIKKEHIVSKALIAYYLDKTKARDIPSVVHVDNSIRPQTVYQKDNPKYYKVIEELGKLTGIEVVLNTSFNVKGEPIVCSPQDALRCFFSTGLDVLAIEVS